MKPLALDSLSDLPKNEFQFLSKYKVILLGEIHGINETPEFALGIVKALNKPVILALEIWHSEQCAIDQFMRKGNLENLKRMPFFNAEPQYGIGSIATANLLQAVRKIPNISLLCFDPFSSDNSSSKEIMASSQKRDKEMAELLIKNFKENSTMVVLTGSIHASSEIQSLFGIDYKPMGYWLRKYFPAEDILTIQLQYEQGKSWGGFSEDGIHILYGVHELPKPTYRTQDENYFQMQNDNNAVLFIKNVTPSFPLKKS